MGKLDMQNLLNRMCGLRMIIEFFIFKYKVCSIVIYFLI